MYTIIVTGTFKYTHAHYEGNLGTFNKMAAESKIKEMLDIGVPKTRILVLHGAQRMASFDVEDIVIRQPNTVTIL